VAGALCDKEQGPARGTGLRRGGVALRSGAEAGVDGRFRPARRGLDFQATAGGYSYGELVTTQEKIIEDFPSFRDFANRPLCCVTILFKPKVLVSPRIFFQILWLARRAYGK
jgi:hypothetical protein